MATRKSAPVKRTAAKAPARAAIIKRTLARTKPARNAPATSAAPDGTKVKHKLVRDSFTIPKLEYAVLADLKQRATRLLRPTKKGELLRAGIGALNAMSDSAFLAALTSVPSLKTGRPKQVTAAKPAAKKT